MILHFALIQLLMPLLRARLLQCCAQQQRAQQQPQQEQQHGGSLEVAGEGGAAGGGSGSGGASGTLNGWNAREELGLVLTALKLLRREASKHKPLPPGGVPELLLPLAPRFSLASFVMQLGCSDHGLASLLPDLLAGLGDSVGGGAGGSAAALPLMARLHEDASAWISREAEARTAALTPGRFSGSRSPAAGEFAGKDIASSATRCTATASAVRSAARHLPAEALLEAEPHRALAAFGHVLKDVLGHPLPSDRAARISSELRLAVRMMKEAAVLLSTEERLVEVCVPGWVWVESVAQARVATEDPEVNLQALWEMTGPNARGGCYEPRQGPIVTIMTSHTEAVPFRSWRWEDHGLYRAEVAALARVRAQEMGMSDGRAAADAGGGPAVWPPRLLRLCANPSCSNYGGGCEAGLKLQQCSKCRGVCYCSAGCQKLHWAQHKEACRRWAAAADE
ncbi:hypothetical protein TSOC_002599 [Tetrabaena socialis]|uniref:MYND-type domain-containing protein n=1 Tax=Tetrabaena socialis TaxID=47790 RepID=A0A2J8ADR7_9CHLO|nr:hypothetical protein TSOC_002599 [Tetrabaena socialis]|eukprot:PNH10653.1 hypothetical protein TSOC_002599 [Tetrabaena socialis]